MATDTFKKVYTVMPDEIKAVIFEMKSKAEELAVYLATIDTREMEIARTNLEQAMMWATKAWVNLGDKVNATN